MQIGKWLIGLLGIALLAGCGSNNSDPLPSSTTEAGGDDNTIVVDKNSTVKVGLKESSKVLTQNNEVYSVTVLVFGPDNAPYEGGKVKVAYPDKVLDGVDVGSFAESEVEVHSGKAVFNYTGPDDLKKLVESGDTQSIFGFYHDSNPADIKEFTFIYQPEADQIVLKDYMIEQSVTELSLGLESTRQMSFFVQDDAGNKVADADVLDMNVTLLSPQLADLQDSTNRKGDSLTFTNVNNVTVSLISYKISGIVPIKVSSRFKDANGDIQTLSKVFNMVILSGPPTAISISYASTEQKEDEAKFIEHMVVTVTDKYFNRVNTKPAISVSLIAGYTRDASTQGRLYATNGGELSEATNSFSVSSANFANVDVANDILVTFGKGYTYASSGKWEISGISDDNHTLNLLDDVTKDETALGYAVGHNYRQDTCRTGREWVGFASLSDNSVQLDVNGMAKVDIDYDYYLTGKDVVLAINITGKDAKTQEITKLGEGVKITLRSTGFDDRSESIPAGAANYVVHLPVKISNTGEWLRNANFVAKLTTSDNIAVNRIEMHGNVGSCSIDGISYLLLDVNETQGKAGSVGISDIMVSDEF